MHLMILGGTGSAGRALIEHLASRASPVDVSVVSRSATALPGTRRVVTGHFADLASSAGFRRLLATTDAVVHLADGLPILQQRCSAADTAHADRLLKNSARLAQAVGEARVPLFITLSSIKALSDEEDARVLDETSEPRSTTLYGRSKLRLEDYIAGIFAGSATRHVIVRNPVTYGRGERGSIWRLLASLDTPFPLPLGGLTNRRSLLCERNLASALGAILYSSRGGPSGIFHVHDGPPLSTTEIAATLREALGRPARLFPTAAWAARAARQVPVLGPIARRLLGSLELSDARFRRTFNWQPLVDTRTALGEMAASFAAGDRRAGRVASEMGRVA